MARFIPFLVALLVSATATTAAAEPVGVSARPLGELLENREIRAPATVLAANQAVITSQVAALVDEVIADVGATVTKGDLLIRLDDDNASLSVAQAEAGLAAIDAQIVEAESRLRRAEELLEKSFVSDDELISRRSAVDVLKANRASQVALLEAAQLDLSRTRVRAPYNAAVIARQAQVGGYAQPGTPLITLVQTDKAEIDVEVDPRNFDNLGQARNARFESRGRSWDVRLARVANVVDVSTRLARARFQFVDESAPIGIAGQLVWSEPVGQVPVSLLVERNKQLGVFVADGRNARFVAIPTAQRGRPATTDLPSTTVVVYEGHTRLQDGDEIRVTR